MTLESLDNALLLNLFQLLDFVNLLRAFCGLNNRFDQLIFTKLQRYHLDFHSISKHDFDIICQEYLSCIDNRVISFRLSDDFETPNLSQFFLSNVDRVNQFIRLKFLSIDHIHSLDRLAQITSQCHELPYLTHISIIINTNKYEAGLIHDLINNIWSLTKVTHFFLDVIYPDPVSFVQMAPVSQSIIYLFTKNIIYNSYDLSYLFNHTSNLQWFYTSHIGFIRTLRTISSSLISLNLIHQILLPSLENLFQSLPNLCYLTLQINDINLDGYAWEKMFIKYFKNIKVFRLKMAVKFSSSNHLKGQVDQLLDSFRSYFWIEKHRWFVRCDWCLMDVNSTGFLYTLPYAFNTFHYIEGSQSKSTSPNTLDYSSYDEIQTFEYKKNSFYDNSPFLPVRFVNIRHLKIKFPFDDKFWLLLPTLDRLLSLDVTLHQNIDYSQLQILLDRATLLYSLHFCHANDFSMTSFNIMRKSIRQLKFYKTPHLVHDILIAQNALF